MKRVATLIGVVVALGIVLFTTGYLRFTYPSKSRYPVRGIDVSHHQGDIDWELLGSTGVSFAYIKATEGMDFKDTRFERNWEEARVAGIPRGAYHFFTFCSPGELQADHFLRVVPPDQRTLPPALDVEFGGNCKNWTSIEDIRRELSACLRKLEAAYETEPVLYVTRESYRRIVAAGLPSYKLWVRGVFRRPDLAAGQEWVFWQFTDRGRLSGVKGFVDLNVFHGARSDFAAILSAGDRRLDEALGTKESLDD